MSEFDLMGGRGGQHSSKMSQIQKYLKGPPYLGHCPKFSCFLVRPPLMKIFSNFKFVKIGALLIIYC